MLTQRCKEHNYVIGAQLYFWTLAAFPSGFTAWSQLLLCACVLLELGVDLLYNILCLLDVWANGETVKSGCHSEMKRPNQTVRTLYTDGYIKPGGFGAHQGPAPYDASPPGLFITAPPQSSLSLQHAHDVQLPRRPQH